MTALNQIPHERPPPGDLLARTVLLVDDSRGQRRLLRRLVEKWGYHVIEAGSAAEALSFCRTTHVDFIISDWMMPGMTGLEFCRAFRALDRDSYGYFILLTSKSERREMVHGLEVGADDFLTKPVNGAELKARLAGGERILRMERELNEKNRMVADALGKLQGLYDTIDRDLIQARKIQESLVPDRFLSFGTTQVSMLLKPCGHVGGDLVGCFSPGPNRLGFYSIDVSGHGVTSALMTARLAGYLGGRFLEQNIALERRFDKFFSLRSPDTVARILNERLLSDSGVEEYFTMIYGVADLSHGFVRLVQAGHPHPLIMRSDGKMEFAGAGGLPIGLLTGVEWSSFDIHLNRGDRLLLYSDGITEAVMPDGEMLDEGGLVDMISPLRDKRGPDFLESLFWALTNRKGADPLDDDVSALLLDFDHGLPD